MILSWKRRERGGGGEIVTDKTKETQVEKMEGKMHKKGGRGKKTKEKGRREREERGEGERRREREGVLERETLPFL